MLDLQELLFSPVSMETFLDEFYERKVLYNENRPSGSFSQLFSMRDAELMLWQQDNNLLEFVQVFGEDDAPLPTGATSNFLYGKKLRHWVFELYRKGSTIRLNDIGRFCLPIAEMERGLMQALRSDVSTNAYLTPPNSQGLKRHFDTHDVLVAQIEGTKTWQLSEPVVELPVPTQLCSVVDEAPQRDITLRPGEVLYLPRGTVHSAKAGLEPSLHLTMGVHPCRWVDLLGLAVEMAAESDVALRGNVYRGRRAVENDDLRREIEALLKAHGVETAALDNVRARYDWSRMSRLRSSPGGDLENRVPDVVELADTVARSAGLVCEVERGPEQASLLFPGLSAVGRGDLKVAPERIDGPAFIAPALEFIADADGPFQVGDLPGAMSDNSKIVLVKRLVREGLLVLCDAPAGGAAEVSSRSG